MALLTLLCWQRKLQNLQFEIFPIHVVQLDSNDKLESRLKGFVERFDLTLDVRTADFDASPRGSRQLSPCFLCAWHRKRALFTAANDRQCNVIALGHHSDDVAITGLMNLFYQGRFGSILPIQHYFKGKFRLIRPLYYISERAIIKLARQESFPISASKCIHAGESTRLLAKGWLDTILKDRPTGKRYLLGALHRQAFELVEMGAPFPPERRRPKK